MLSRLLAVLLVLPAALLGAQSATAANPICEQTDLNGKCILWAGSDGGGSGSKSSSGGSDDILILTVNGKQCIYKGLKKPQPDKSDPVWEGHTDGAIHICGAVVAEGRVPGMYYDILFWSPPASPSAEAVAQTAIEEMDMEAPQIAMTGWDGPNPMQIVGWPTWLWVADPGEGTTDPVTRTASAGGMTVTATATLDRTVWDMGDGSTVTCAGSDAAGTVYEDGFGKKESPTCGHTYSRHGSYTVTVTAYWTIGWQSNDGEVGTIPMSFTRSTQIRVGEVQVLAGGAPGGR